MADILIRGMELPRDCSVCELSQKRVFASSVMCPITGQTVGYYDHGFHLEKHDCPLVPLPAEHGRLIDADELQHVIGSFSLAWEYGQGVSDCFAALKSAPTIIKAEGEI